MQVQYLDWEDLPGGGHGNPVQYSCLENPMDRGAWRATAHRVVELNTTEVTNSNSSRTHHRSRELVSFSGLREETSQYTPTF